jgi:hypothetical protein
MAKTTGLGDGLIVTGYDVSGDVGSIGSIQQTFGEQDMTSIGMSAIDRMQLIENGSLGFNNFFSSWNSESAEARSVHDILTGAVPGTRTTHAVSYHRGREVGSWVANLDAMRFSYSLARAQSGSLLGTVNCSSTEGNDAAIEWSRALTAFVVSPVAAIEYEAFELGAADVRAFLQLIEFDGTDAVIKVQDSANGTTGWADLMTLWDSAADDPPPDAIVMDYTSSDANDFLRVVVETTGGFTALSFAASVHGL